jgi:hypothetical protein
VEPYRGADWTDRVTGGGAVAYTFFRRLGRGGWYLTASWATPVESTTGPVKLGVVAGVDLNDGSLAVRQLDESGNPVGAPGRIVFEIAGGTKRRDAQVRHAVSKLIRWCTKRGVDAIAIEDLDFADARSTGRETMGRGKRGKAFRGTISGIPTAVFRGRLAGMVANTGLRLIAVNPAYTSAWGGPALAQAVREYPTRGCGHRDRPTRPGIPGEASGRCDPRTTRGSSRESCRPGPT